ncbi:HAD family hydrolase [Bifidobacterium stellenboschense]|uniref:Haloacid dehalogenase-like hydrolase n=1 Tax=Bifidobacterium stellenboschense TaxID=762211 RepID=A0A087DBS4_9BIFI|nr:HAD family hydrolase [Bifidobacterium stellenboschense]KFI92974.1 haloacid dehalogenase-like hydrolase [Bifidobacterium stellenboschense]
MPEPVRERRYDTVFFDLYGTLVDIRTDEESPAAWEALREVLEDHSGVTFRDAAALKAWFDTLAAPVLARAADARGGNAEPDLLPVYAALAAERTVVDPASRGPRAVAMADVGELANLGPTVLPWALRLAWTFRRASTNLLRLYPGAAAMLTRLREAGLTVVLVSNAQSGYTRPELRWLDLEPLFDGIVISSEVGVRKPSPDIYHIALDGVLADPGRTVMVGNDERADILGAKGAGIDGVYLRTAISPQDDPQASTHAVLSLDGPDYAGLMEFLGV